MMMHPFSQGMHHLKPSADADVRMSLMQKHKRKDVSQCCGNPEDRLESIQAKPGVALTT